MSLWGGRFSTEPSSAVAALSRSVEFDWRLAPYDIKVNLAHLDGLIASGVIDRKIVDRVSFAARIAAESITREAI